MAKTLKVKAVQNRLQPNFAAFEAGVRRFVGCRFDQTLGEKDSKGVAQGGFLMLEEGEEVPMIAEYVQAVKQGDLLPADQETARLCGVKFQAVQTSLAVTVSK